MRQTTVGLCTVLGTALALLLIGAGAAQEGQPEARTTRPSAGDLAYVTLAASDLVALVDTAADTSAGSVDVGAAGCDFPWQATMSPDGEHVYVGCYDSGNVAVIETASSTVITTVQGITRASAIAFARDGAYAIVDSGANDRVFTVDTATYATSTLLVEADVRDVAVHPYLELAYATSRSNFVAVVDLTTGEVIETVPVGKDPGDAAISPDGRWLFVADQWDGGLSVIETGANRVYTTVTGLENLRSLAVAPDGSRVYVSGATSDVHVIDGASFERIAAIGAITTPQEIALSCDGSKLYVSDLADRVTVVDTATFSTTRVSLPGTGARGLTACPLPRQPKLLLVPAAQSRYAIPGSSVTYQGRLVNSTGRTDNFQLSPQPGHAWAAALSLADTGPLSDSGSITFTLQVTVPSAAQPGEMDALTVLATSSLAYTGSAAFQTFAGSGDLAYVTVAEKDRVALVDTTVHASVGSLDVGAAGCQHPWRAEVSPDGGQVYVGCYDSDNVAVIDTVSNTVVDVISGVASPNGIAFTREGDYALVGSRWDNQIIVVDTETRAAVWAIPAPANVQSIAAHPHRNLAYAAISDGAVLVLDTSAFDVAAAIPVGGEPWDVAVSPDGRWVLVTDLLRGRLTVIDAGSNAVHTTVEGSGGLAGLAIAPDGSRIYVAARRSGVHLIDGAAFGYVTTIPNLGNAWEAALSEDGNELYVGDAEGQVFVVDTTTLATIDQVALTGPGARGIAIRSPRGAPGVHLTPASQLAYGEPGETVAYVGELINAAGHIDRFALSLADQDWDVTLSPADSGPVAHGERISFTVRVAVPPTAAPGDVDTVAVRATSLASPTLAATATVQTHAASGQFGYVAVAEEDRVLLVDTAAHAIIGDVKVTDAGCRYPHRAAMAPDGGHVCVSCRDSDRVIVVDTADNQVTGVVGVPSPGGLAFTRAGDRVLAASLGSDQLFMVDTASAITAAIAAPSEVRGVAAHPYLDLAYAASAGGDLLVVDTRRLTVAAAIPLASDPWDVAISPDGAGTGPTWVYVGNRWGAGLAVIDADAQRVHTTTTGLDFLTGLAVAPDSAGAGPTRVYAAAQWRGLHVLDFDKGTASYSTTVAGLGRVSDVALTCEGASPARLYVGNAAGRLSILDPATLTVTGQITLPGAGPLDLALCPPFRSGGLALAPAAQSGPAAPGQRVVYEGRLVNETGAADSFALSLSGQTWDAAISPAATGLLPAGDSITFTVQVTAPLAAAPGATDTVNIRAASATHVATATIETAATGDDVAYVTLSNSDAVALVDTATGIAVGSVDVGAAGCDYPWRAAMAPDGSAVYVSCYDSHDVAVIGTAGDSVVTTVAGVPSPSGIAFVQDGAYALVGSGDSQIVVVDTATYLTTSIDTLSATHGVAAHPYLDLAYVTADDGALLVVDTARFTVTAAIPVSSDPWGVDVSPDGQWVFVADRWSGELTMVDASDNTVHAIGAGLGNLAGLAVAPGGGTIYAAAQWDGVHVLDGQTLNLVETIEGLGNAWEVALTCDGNGLYVGDTKSGVARVDLETMTAADSVPLSGTGARGLAVCPQTQRSGLILAPTRRTGYAAPGERIVYEGRLINRTGQTHSFDLALLAGHAWSAVLSPTHVSGLPSGGWVSYTVQVTLPLAAEPGAKDTVLVQASSATHTVTATIQTYAAGDLAYVTLADDDRVALVDTATRAAVGSVDVGAAGCDHPWRAAMAPDGAYVYVSCRDSDNVAVVETAGHTVATMVEGADSPVSIAFVQDGAYALVGSRWTTRTVAIDAATYLTSVVATPHNVRDLAAHPYLDRAYATCSQNTVAVIDTAALVVTDTIHTGGSSLQGVAVSPDGHWVFVADQHNERLIVIDASRNRIHVTVAGLGALTDLAVAPDGAPGGATVYAAAGRDGVYLVDGATFTPYAVLSALGNASQIALAGDGSELYVGNGSSQMPVVDEATFPEADWVVLPGSGAQGIAAGPPAGPPEPALAPMAQTGRAAPGEAVAYGAYLVNTTGRADRFDLLLQATPAWTTTLSLTRTETLSDSAWVYFTAQVTVPLSASPGATDTVVVEARSVTSPAVYTTAAAIHTTVSDDLAYVTLADGDQVALVDVASHAVVDAVDVGAAGCDYPRQAEMAPDRRAVYVTCPGSDSVAVIETAGNSVATVVEGIPEAYSVAFANRGDHALVSSRWSKRIVAVNTTDYATATIATPADVLGLAAHPVLDRAYAASSDGTLLVIDTSALSINAAIPVGMVPGAVAVSPDGSRVYVGEHHGPNLVVIDTDSQAVSATMTDLDALSDLSVTRDGSTIYAAARWGGVHAIDAATLNHIGAVATVGKGQAAAPTCDGGALYVATGGSWLPVVDTATLSPTRWIALPDSGALGVAVCPPYDVIRMGKRGHPATAPPPLAASADGTRQSGPTDAAREQERVRVLFDFEDDDLSGLSASGARMDLVAGDTGRALRVRCGHHLDWPGVSIVPSEGRWDFSGYRHLKLDVKNTGYSGAHVGLRVDNPGATGSENSLAVSEYLLPGAAETLVVDLSPTSNVVSGETEILWMNGNPQPRLDLGEIVRMRFYAPRPSRDQELVIDNVRLEGRVETLSEEEFFPFVGELGQFAHDDWPGKTHSVAEMGLRREVEEADLAARARPEAWDRYGGWASGPQFEAAGFFRVQKHNGKWWFVDPDGHLFWSHGVTGVSYGSRTYVTRRERYFHGLPRPGGSLDDFYSTQWDAPARGPEKLYLVGVDFAGLNLYRKYGEDWRALAGDAALRRLQSWGLNTLGGWLANRLRYQARMPYVVQIKTHSRKIEGSWGYWTQFPDVFDPSFRDNILYQLRTTYSKEVADPWCIGFMVDNELTWGDEVYLATSALTSTVDQPAKQVFVADLRAKYGDIGRLNARWGSDYASWEDLLESEEEPDRRRAWADLGEFNARIVQTYLETARQAVKQVAPNHLFMCSRFGGWFGNDQTMAAAGVYCDVMTSNMYERYGIERFRLPDGIDRPVMIGEYHIGALDRGLFWTGLERAKTQEQRAALYDGYVRGALLHPNVVGAHWFQYRDQPATARSDGENGQLGFVTTADAPYPELVAASREVGDDLYAYRLGSQQLTVVRDGMGRGAVTSDPPGIDCGSDCVESWAHNAAITLTATPDAGSTFAGWRGGGLDPACSTAGYCAVTMDTIKYVVAVFEAGPAHPVYLPLVLKSF